MLIVTTITLITLISCDTVASSLPPTPTYTITPLPTPSEETMTPSVMVVATRIVSTTATIVPASTPVPSPTIASPVEVISSYPTLAITEEVSFELVNQWAGQIEAIAIADNIAYLGEGMHLTILSIADPPAPRLLGQSQTFSDIVHAILVRENIAYLGVGASVITLDVSNPKLPTIIDEISLPGSVTHLALENNILVAGTNFTPSDSHENGLGLLATIRISQLNHLQQLDLVVLPWPINAMVLGNKVLYVSNPTDATFYAVNITDPTNLPDPIAFSVAPLTYSLQVQDQTLFVGGGLSNLSAWKIDSLSRPEKLWEIQAEPDSDFGLGVVTDFVIVKNIAYLGVISYHGQTIGSLALEVPTSVEGNQAIQTSSSVAYQDGYIYFADGELAIYDVIHGGHAPVGGFANPEVWDVAATDDIGVFIDGNEQQANNNGALYTVTLPDLGLLGQYPDEKRCQRCYSSFVEFEIANNIAYVSASDDGLRVISLEDQGNPELLASLDATNGFSDFRVAAMAIDSKRLFATNRSCNGLNLLIVDLLDLYHPHLLSKIGVEGCIEKLVINNDTLFVAVNASDGESSKIYLFDIVSPEPRALGVATLSESINDIQLLNNTAIVATVTGIKTVAADDPANIHINGELLIPGGIYRIAIQDNIVFATTIADSSHGLLAVDSTVPSVPRLVGRFALPTKGELSVNNEYLLVGNPTMGLVVLQIKILEESSTEQTVTLTEQTDTTVCLPPSDLLETEVDILAAPFCIVWIDKFTDETGFQIVLEYPQSGEQFVYETEANVTQFLVPQADAPRLAESQEQCLKRKDWQVKVAALRPGGLHPFAETAVTIECNPTLLPTATRATP